MNYARTKKKKKKELQTFIFIYNSLPPSSKSSMEKSAANVPFFFFFSFYHNRNPIGIEAIFHLLTRIDTVFSFLSFLGEEIHASTARVDKFEDATHPRAIHPTVTRFAKGSGNCHEITRKLMQHALNAWTRYHIRLVDGLPSFPPFFFFSIFFLFFYHGNDVNHPKFSFANVIRGYGIGI